MEMDEGKVDWDQPVREYLPTFKMYDPVLTEHDGADGGSRSDYASHRIAAP